MSRNPRASARGIAGSGRPHRRPLATDEFRSAYLAAGVAMARLTQQGAIIDGNAAFARLVHRTEEELAGMQLLDLLHPADAASLRAGRLSTFKAGTILAELRFRAAGRIVWGRAAISLARRADDAPDSLILTVEDLTAQKAHEEAVERDRLHDPATGLPNTVFLTDRLARSIVAARRAGRRLAVVAIEIGPLPSFGEGSEPVPGDQLLTELGTRLRERVRPSDCVARTGSNELAVVLGDVREADLAAGVVRRLLEGLELEFRLAGVGVPAPVGMGVALFPEHGARAESLLRHARIDMYIGHLTEVPAPPVVLTGGAASAAQDGPAGVADDELDAGVERRVGMLEPVSLFLSLPDMVLRRIARYMSEQTASAGTELSGPGSPAALRVIHEGICEVRSGNSEGSLSLLTLGPGDFLGFDALVLENPLPVHVKALTDCSFLVLDEPMIARAAPAGSAFREALRQAAGQRDSHLRALIARPQRAASASAATHLAVYSTKGGSGRTTLALNMAAELGRRHAGEVLVVDMALPYNHVALMANLSPSTCLARIADASDDSFGKLAWSAVLPHPAGFMVLPTALRPEEAELVKPQLLARAVSTLAPQFRYVIFDLGIALDDCVLAALELCDHLVLVATPELASMHDTRQVIELATRVLQIPSGRVHTVLNHRSPDSALSRKVVEQVLGREMAAELRYLGARPELTGLDGGLQVQTDRSSPFSRAVRSLVDRLDSMPAKLHTA